MRCHLRSCFDAPRDAGSIRCERIGSRTCQWPPQLSCPPWPRLFGEVWPAAVAASWAVDRQQGNGRIVRASRPGADVVRGACLALRGRRSGRSRLPRPEQEERRSKDGCHDDQAGGVHRCPPASLVAGWCRAAVAACRRALPGPRRPDASVALRSRSAARSEQQANDDVLLPPLEAVVDGILHVVCGEHCPRAVTHRRNGAGSLGHLHLPTQAHRPHPGQPRRGQAVEHAPEVGDSPAVRAVCQSAWKRGSSALVVQLEAG